MMQRGEPLPADAKTTIQWSDHAPGSVEMLEQRPAEQTARDLAGLKDYGERCQRLEDMRSELTEKYPDRWVALTEANTQVVADTITELVTKIEQGGGRPGYAARKFMNSQPRRHIL